MRIAEREAPRNYAVGDSLLKNFIVDNSVPLGLEIHCAVDTCADAARIVKENTGILSDIFVLLGN